MERRYSHPGHLRKLIDAQWPSEVLAKPRHYFRDPLPLRAKAQSAEDCCLPDRKASDKESPGVSDPPIQQSHLAMDPRGTPLAFIASIYGGETQGRPVPADAPPLFTVVAQDDRTLFRLVEGPYADWSSADRPAKLHSFTCGGHGFGVGKRGLPVDRWTDLLGDWLADQGFA
jgi:hypothetical protein